MNINKEKPKEVQRIERLLQKNSLWYNLTWNHKAVSCPDAAKKRNRLGHTGIPLCDEFKTYLGTFKKNGSAEYVLLHCRGTQEIDEVKVNNILLAPFSRLEKDKSTKEEKNAAKGLINPFIKIENKNILQLFDESLFIKHIPPYTMMTNAGDYNWGFEFHPEELIKILPNTKVYDLIDDQYKYDFKKHKIGILTGNGYESGILLWDKINKKIKYLLKSKQKNFSKLEKNYYFMGDLSYPEVVIESLPEMGISMELELRNERTKEIVLNSITRLCKNGATIICIACNTTQYYVNDINKICKQSGALFISMPNLVDIYLTNNEHKEFDFIGIKYVTDFLKWSAFKTLDQKYTVHLPLKKDLDAINDIAFIVKENGPDNKARNRIRSLLNKITKTQTVIVALTEIALLLDSENNKFIRKRKYIDTLSLIADEIAKIYVEGFFNTCYNRSKQKKTHE